LLILGFVLIFAGVRLAAASKQTVQNVTLNVDLPGNVQMDTIKCQSCGAPLAPEDIKLVNGAVTVQCHSCGTTYQITEQPNGKQMNKLKHVFLLITILLLLIPLGSAQAQDYRFSLTAYEVEAYLEADGTLTLYYYMAFQNDPSGHAIDFVDLGLPTTQYKLSDIKAEVNGVKMPEVNDSAYVQGAELALGEYAIQPGQSGIITAWVYGIKGVLSPYDGADRTDYANFFFVPNYFGSQYDSSQNTEYRMTIILPPGVGAEQGVWYEPSGWPGPSEPEATLTTDGRVNYSWYTTNADVHSEYLFGAAFPASAIPAGVLTTNETIPSDTGSSGSTTSPEAGFLPRCGKPFNALSSRCYLSASLF